MGAEANNLNHSSWPTGLWRQSIKHVLKEIVVAQGP